MDMREIFEAIIADAEVTFELTPVEVAKPNWTAMTDMATNGRTEVAN